MLVFSYKGDTGTYSLYGVYVSAVKTDQELFQNKTKMKSCLLREGEEKTDLMVAVKNKRWVSE